MAISSSWKNTVDDGIANDKWDGWDSLIEGEIAEYNRRLKPMAGFPVLDWKLFKAMLWVESGGPGNSEWNSRPFRIGVPRDKGLKALQDERDAAQLIMSPDLAKTMKTGDLRDPNLNIRAGIAYAVSRLVKSDDQSVDDPGDRNLYPYTVAPGDSYARIAGKVGSTVASLEAVNGKKPLLKLGEKLSYRKASVRRVILGWFPPNTATMAARYNGFGDADYQDKLDYVLTLFSKLQRTEKSTTATGKAGTGK